jgi:hypothetical protein
MFIVDSSQIERLESKALVLLLKRLLHAEARAAEVPLSAVGVPLQINVPDGAKMVASPGKRVGRGPNSFRRA